MQLINRIHFRNVGGDLFGGVTAAIIALPMALAFGVASGAGPVAGLYGAVIIGFFAAIFGGTPTLISEPTGPMTVIMTAVIASYTATNPETGLAMAFTVVMMGGLFQILFGVLGLGKYITLMPYTVISGFMSGIGIILIVLQIPAFLGQANPGGVFNTIVGLPELISNINPPETILGVLTVALIFLTPSRVGRIIPPQLVALIVGTVVSLIFFSNVNIRIIGEIPAALPQLQMPVLSGTQLTQMLVDAAMLAMLGAIDALLTSTVADSLTDTQHNSDKELVGQGIGNLMSGLCGGLPGAGATMGTVVNIQAGGRTPLSGIFRAAILLVVVLWAGSLTQNIPMAVLAGIALKVGFDIIDWEFMKRAHKISVKAAWIMYGVILLTVFVNLMIAVAIGVFVANVITIKRMSELQAERVKAITDEKDDTEILLSHPERQILKQANGGILLLHLSGSMIFGAAQSISKQFLVAKNYQALIIDFSNVSHMGVTSTLAIENAIENACKKGRQVFIVGVSGKIKRRLERFNIFNLSPSPRVTGDRFEALEQAVALINHDRPNGPNSSQELEVNNSVSKV